MGDVSVFPAVGKVEPRLGGSLPSARKGLSRCGGERYAKAPPSSAVTGIQKDQMPGCIS